MSMTKEYEALRNDDIHKLGITEVLKGEAICDKWENTPMQDVVHTKDGYRERLRTDVADVLRARRLIQSPRTSITVPYIPGLHDKKTDENSSSNSGETSGN